MCALEAESTLDIHQGHKNILWFYFPSKQVVFKPRSAPWHPSDFSSSCAQEALRRIWGLVAKGWSPLESFHELFHPQSQEFSPSIQPHSAFHQSGAISLPLQGPSPFSHQSLKRRSLRNSTPPSFHLGTQLAENSGKESKNSAFAWKHGQCPAQVQQT